MKKTYILMSMLLLSLTACAATSAVQPVSLVPATSTAATDPKLDSLMDVLSTSSSSTLRSLSRAKAKQLATTACAAGSTVNSEEIALDQMVLKGSLAMNTSDIVNFVDLVHDNYC